MWEHCFTLACPKIEYPLTVHNWFPKQNRMMNGSHIIHMFMSIYTYTPSFKQYMVASNTIPILQYHHILPTIGR